MYVQKIAVKNFRLLQDIELFLEQQTTVIVGRNNSGKTSLTELFRRVLSDQPPKFCLEDFSLNVHEQFWEAFNCYQQGQEDANTRAALPYIELKLTIDYKNNDSALSVLSDFIIDVDDKCTTSIIVMRYQLRSGKVEALFADIASKFPQSIADDKAPNNINGFISNDSQNFAAAGTHIEDQPIKSLSAYETEQRLVFFRIIRERVQKLFHATLEAVDPSDATNTKSVEWTKLNLLVHSGFINAQRGLDDITHTDRNTLGKILEALFSNALSESAQPEDQAIAQEIERAVQSLQQDINSNFGRQLKSLLPSLALFGYPGLKDPQLQTETTLDASRLLKDHTKIHYMGLNGINLPETYNGLGARNLICILLNLLEFFKAYKTALPMPGVQLVFIEEPEAHLHPQMQSVFIRQLSEIAKVFAQNYNQSEPWPVQFVVSTHSSHLANEASFEATRYFLTTTSKKDDNVFMAKIKDLRHGLSDTPDDDKDFLHQYMTLTRCDLLFSDKAVLIEGTSERLLLPNMIKKIDASQRDTEKLSSQYISVVEVGGAYAHIFFKLLDFLELPTLIITDIDSVDHDQHNTACYVSSGTRTSNACIKDWFGDPKITPHCLVQKCDNEKIKGTQRIAYQVPETSGGACGRSLEGAFILANPALFGLVKTCSNELEAEAAAIAKSLKKSDFALKYAIKETNWNVPRYIAEGLRWLALNPNTVMASVSFATVTVEGLLDAA